MHTKFQISEHSQQFVIIIATDARSNPSRSLRNIRDQNLKDKRGAQLNKINNSTDIRITKFRYLHSCLNVKYSVKCLHSWLPRNRKNVFGKRIFNAHKYRTH